MIYLGNITPDTMSFGGQGFDEAYFRGYKVYPASVTPTGSTGEITVTYSITGGGSGPFRLYYKPYFDYDNGVISCDGVYINGVLRTPRHLTTDEEQYLITSDDYPDLYGQDGTIRFSLVSSTVNGVSSVRVPREFIVNFYPGVVVNTVTIDDGVDFIDRYALKGVDCNFDNNTKYVINNLIPPTIKRTSFTTSNPDGYLCQGFLDIPIYVPASVVDTYKNAEYWSLYASRIQAIPE